MKFLQQRKKYRKSKCEPVLPSVRQFMKHNPGPHICYYCEHPLDDTNASWDHIIPVSKGGYYGKENRILACRTCNNQKGDSLDLFWIKGCKK